MIPEFCYVDDIADAPCREDATSDEDNARQDRSRPTPELARWRYRRQEVTEDFAERMPHENIR